ncbi:MAG TPA: hypothetical protein VLG44_05170, partial [Chlamydiales bacterium]|nr:hypothetical protein [Chlamydiales bacterium]
MSVAAVAKPVFMPTQERSLVNRMGSDLLNRVCLLFLDARSYVNLCQSHKTGLVDRPLTRTVAIPMEGRKI